MDMYYGPYFVKPFPFDDIYLSIVAKKMGIDMLNCPQFHFHRSAYTPQQFRYVVASHQFGDPQELEKTWNQQKMAGNA